MPYDKSGWEKNPTVPPELCITHHSFLFNAQPTDYSSQPCSEPAHHHSDTASHQTTALWKLPDEFCSSQQFNIYNAVIINFFLRCVKRKIKATLRGALRKEVRLSYIRQRRVILLRSDIWTNVQVIFTLRVLRANIIPLKLQVSISLCRKAKYHCETCLTISLIVIILGLVIF